MRLTTFLSMLVLVAMSAMAVGCVIVEPNHAGVASRFNQMIDTYPEGWHIAPFVSAESISLKGQTTDIVVSADGTDSAIVSFVVTPEIQCAEGDTECVPAEEDVTLQPLGYSANISWRVASASAARELYLAYDLRENGEALFASQHVFPIGQDAAKSTFGSYNLRQLLVEDRALAANIVRDTMQRLLDDRLRLVENGTVVIDAVTITNYDYDDDLDEMFRATVSASEARNLAQQTLERETVEAQTRVVEAEANRQAAVTNAEGQAESARIVADASRYAREQEAASLAALSESGVDVNEYLMVEMMTDTWEGGVPLVQASGGGSNGSSPIVLPLNLNTER